MALEELKDGDHMEEHSGLKIGVEKDFLEIYQGFEVDFKKNWFSKGFVVLPKVGRSRC